VASSVVGCSSADSPSPVACCARRNSLRRAKKTLRWRCVALSRRRRGRLSGPVPGVLGAPVPVPCAAGGGAGVGVGGVQSVMIFGPTAGAPAAGRSATSDASASGDGGGRASAAPSAVASAGPASVTTGSGDASVVTAATTPASETAGASATGSGATGASATTGVSATGSGATGVSATGSGATGVSRSGAGSGTAGDSTKVSTTGPSTGGASAEGVSTKVSTAGASAAGVSAVACPFADPDSGVTAAVSAGCSVCSSEAGLSGEFGVTRRLSVRAASQDSRPPWDLPPGEVDHPPPGHREGRDVPPADAPERPGGGRRHNGRTVPGTALLVVDVQQAFGDASFWGARNNPACEANIARLIDDARARGDAVVFVRHDSVEAGSPLAPGHPGNAFQDVVTGEPDLLVTKHVNSAFLGEQDLDGWLRERGIDTIAVCGIQTNMCCETTARMGGNLGYDVRFVIDATHTFELRGPGGRVFSADDVAEMTAANLDGEFATVLGTADYLKR
jgi:nicotinamidase-related amidase